MQEINIAEFYLENGSYIKLHHKIDVVHLNSVFDLCVKDNIDFFIGQWHDLIEKLEYNGREINAKHCMIPVKKVDLYRFEGKLIY